MSIETTVKKYIGLHIKQTKFEIVEFVAEERSKLIIGTTLAVISTFLVLFGSLYASFLLNDLLESSHIGFGIVFLFWTTLFSIVWLSKSSIKSTLFRNYTNRNIPS